MLEAKKNRIFESLFAIYNRNLLKRRFKSFKVSGLNYLLNHDANIPLLIYCNHSSWWDGLAIFQISYKAKLDSFVLMEEKNLKRYFLFRMLGAFSIDRNDPRSAVESLKYSVKLFETKSSRTLWIFPQGEILPNDCRPIRFFRGMSKIVEDIGDCHVASLSINYEFLQDFKPEIFVRIHEPEQFKKNDVFNSKLQTEMFSQTMTKNLDQLRIDIINNSLSEYESIF